MDLVTKIRAHAMKSILDVQFGTIAGRNYATVNSAK
jgi:hypothetical protein